jgi:hypothetical protein
MNRYFTSGHADPLFFARRLFVAEGTSQRKSLKGGPSPSLTRGYFEGWGIPCRVENFLTGQKKKEFLGAYASPSPAKRIELGFIRDHKNFPSSYRPMPAYDTKTGGADMRIVDSARFFNVIFFQKLIFPAAARDQAHGSHRPDDG